MRRKTLPDGQTITYQRYLDSDDQGKLRALVLNRGRGDERVLAGELEFDYDGAISQIDYGNGAQLQSTFNSGQLTGINSAGLALQYSYSANGEIESINVDGMLKQYQYDQQGRLKGQFSAGETTGYSYDYAGNRSQSNSNSHT